MKIIRHETKKTIGSLGLRSIGSRVNPLELAYAFMKLKRVKKSTVIACYCTNLTPHYSLGLSQRRHRSNAHCPCHYTIQMRYLTFTFMVSLIMKGAWPTETNNMSHLQTTVNGHKLHGHHWTSSVSSENDQQLARGTLNTFWMIFHIITQNKFNKYANSLCVGECTFL